PGRSQGPHAQGRDVPAVASGADSPVGVFTLTADSADGLRRNLAAQAAAVARHGRSVAALCWSSNRAKTGLPYRYAVTARDTEELAGALRRAALAPAAARAAVRPSGAPVVGFLYTGQGSAYPGMTAGLYRDLPAYRRHLDEADAALAPHTGHSVRELLLTGDERITGARLAQPALFAVQYALSRTLTGLGVRPAAVLGHSAGEYAAAVTAGALGLADAARLVATRAALMAELPVGTGMLAVRGARDRVEALLAEEPHLVLAVVNGPGDTALSGSLPALERAAAALAAQGLRARFLDAPVGFHSPAVAPVLPRLREAAAGIAVRRPEVPFVSTRYGRLLRDEPLDAGYWAAQAAAPVLFADALGALMRQSAPTHLLELGPRPHLLGLAGRGGFGEGVEFLHPCPGPAATGRELADVVATLYRAGLDPDWSALYAPEHRRPERLAPYVFDDRPRFPQAPAPAAGAGDAVAVEARGDEPAERRQAPEAGRPPLVAAVIRAVADVGGYPVAELTAGARFYEDLGFDSVMIMQLKDRIEARLPQLGELSVPDLIPALRSIESLAAHLGALPEAEAAAGARVPATAGAGGE
ncbi:acyltransferase domain-containing protein, partial [Streptomyces sp. AF1A]|uniref:acyltransferase domain-containing protein n=1 Tax=Streptomyces sp. AF1A TaxID=3394350 RepID=UPI0039BD7441